MLRRYWPPTLNSASVICPSEVILTVSAYLYLVEIFNPKESLKVYTPSTAVNHHANNHQCCSYAKYLGAC